MKRERPDVKIRNFSERKEMKNKFDSNINDINSISKRARVTKKGYMGFFSIKKIYVQGDNRCLKI